MARDFTPKDAKKLIKIHKDLLRMPEEMALTAQDPASDVRRAAERLSLRMESIVTRELESGIQADMLPNGTEQLISALYRYQKLPPILAAAKKFRDLHKEQVQRAILLLTPATSGIQWLFTGGNAKKQAEEAYRELQLLAEGAYAREMQAMSDETDALQMMPTEEIWLDFSEHRSAYQELFAQLTEGKFRRTGRQNLFKDLKEVQTHWEAQIARCDAGDHAYQEHISTAAMKLVAAQAMELLKDVPVEELNRERGGIRVKALRDHGYCTVADVYAASVHQLESIHGISEDTAYTIKRLARELLEQAKNNSKVRLSTDKRTKEATELISSVYGYRVRDAKRKELDHFLSEHRSSVARARKKLDQLETVMDWPFCTPQQKQEIAEGYAELKRYRSGDYGWTIRQRISGLTPGNYHNSPEAWKDFSQNSVAYFNILENIVPGILGNDDSLYGLPEALALEIQEEAFFPDGLLCELRRYQEWGVKYALHQERVLLGDEMGLGKTVQAIATMVSLRNTGATHFMVVCPASVLTNWCREIRKMSKLSVTKIHGSGRLSAAKSWLRTGGVAVTTYETTGHIKLEDGFQFSMLVVDEAHYIKNPEAQRTQNVQTISEHAERLLFMTGTALENKVEEMVSLIRMLQPEVAASVRGMEFMSSAPQFREKVSPVYYRRKREDVLTELPELIESKEWCSLTAAEEAVYEEAVLNKQYAEARRVSWNVEDLRDSSKARRMMELIADAKEDGRKVIVFSFFLDTIRKVTELTGDQCFGPINGSVTPQRRQEIIDQFDKAPAGAVLAAQIQAGGTGLNIQSASVVIICEPQFKPSIENQAVSRAYRMGQTRNVLVYRLLCEDTVDERITSILESKQAIFDAFADKSDAAARSMELDDKTFGNIIKEEIDRINAKRGGTIETSNVNKEL